MKTILATTSSFAKGYPELSARIQQAGYILEDNPHSRKLTESELMELLQRHQPIGLLAGTEPITRRVIEGARSHLKVISRVGVGWDNVDRAAAAEHGMSVYRTEGVLTQSVAELTLGLILGALRAIPLHHRQLCQNQWKKHMGGLLHGKLVGIIGFGAIGQRVGELVRAFGARVCYYDPETKPVDWAEAVSLSQLLATAAIITLHAGGKAVILGQNELKTLERRGIILVNTGRGELVDPVALQACLADGRLAWAALDVFAEEPYHGPLCELDNVILTPHVGSYAEETRRAMEELAVEHLLAGLNRA